jgi:hypothetical protein
MESNSSIHPSNSYIPISQELISHVKRLDGFNVRDSNFHKLLKEVEIAKLKVLLYSLVETELV